MTSQNRRKMQFLSQKQNSGEREKAILEQKTAHSPHEVCNFTAARDRFSPDFYHPKNTIPKC